MHNTGDKASEVYLINPAQQRRLRRDRGPGPRHHPRPGRHRRRRRLRLALRAHQRQGRHLRQRAGQRRRRHQGRTPAVRGPVAAAAHGVPRLRRRRARHPGGPDRQAPGRHQGGQAWPRRGPTGSPPTSRTPRWARPTAPSPTSTAGSTAARTACPAAWRTRTSPASTGSSTACGTTSRCPRSSRYADHLVPDVTGLRKAFPKQDFDPSDLPLRTHEILENALQFELTGDTDEGSGTNLATADANLAGTKELLSVLRPLISRARARPAGHRRRRHQPPPGAAGRRPRTAPPGPRWSRSTRPPGRRSTAPPGSCSKTWRRSPTCSRSGSPREARPRPPPARQPPAAVRAVDAAAIAGADRRAPTARPQHAADARTAPAHDREAARVRRHPPSRELRRSPGHLPDGRGPPVVREDRARRGRRCRRAGRRRLRPHRGDRRQHRRGGRLLGERPVARRRVPRRAPGGRHHPAVRRGRPSCRSTSSRDEPQGTGRAVPDAHRAGALPHRRRHPADLGVGAPPSDNGILGPTVPADALTVTARRRLVAVRRPLRPGRRQAAPAGADAGLPQRQPPGPPSATATCRCRSAPAARTRCCTRCATSPGTPAARCRSSGGSTASRTPPRPTGAAAQPARLQGRHRQPRRASDARDGPARSGSRDRRGEPAWADRRQLPGDPDHPDAGGVLGPGLAHRAGADVRPPQGHRRAAGRRRGDRRARLRQGPERRRRSRSTRTSGWPTRAPPKTADTRILRRGYNYDRGVDAGRQPRHGPGLLLLPAGRGAAVRGGRRPG